MNFFLPFKVEKFILPLAGAASVNLTRLQPEAPIGTSLLMLHGLMGSASSFYNPATQVGLASYLAQAGYDVYLAELRGRQLTGAELKQLNFSLLTALTQDIPALVDKFVHLSQGQKRFWLGKGLGSLLLTSYLARNQQQLADLQGIIHFNSQTLPQADTKSHQLWLHWVEQRGVDKLAQFLGYVPAVKLKLGQANEHLGFYNEIKAWLTDVWQNPDNNNYLNLLQDIELPPSLYFAQQTRLDTQSIDFSRDFMRNLGSHNGRLIKLGKKLGNSKTYKNSLLCLDPKAETDYYPLLLNWLREMAASSE